MRNNDSSATCPICSKQFTGKRSREHPNDDGTAIYALIEHLETCGRQCRYCTHWIATAQYTQHLTECKAKHYTKLATVNP